jgi:uridine kinase
VISLDGWLRPVPERPEGAGVLARFDLDRAFQDIADIVAARTPRSVSWPRHDRNTRTLRAAPPQVVEPDDLLIVEGVPALLHAPLRELADLRLQITIDEAERRRRFELDYRLRGRDDAAIAALFAARSIDETPVVEAAAVHADLRLSLGARP